MNLEEFSPHTQRYIATKIGEGLFHSPVEVINALVEKEKQADVPPAKKQLTLEERKQLIEECRAVAVNHPFDDGLNGSVDHDKILYSNY